LSNGLQTGFQTGFQTGLPNRIFQKKCQTAGITHPNLILWVLRHLPASRASMSATLTFTVSASLSRGTQARQLNMAPPDGKCGSTPPKYGQFIGKHMEKHMENMMTNHGSMMIHVWYHMWYHGTLSDFQLSVETILLLNCKCGWQLLIN